MRPLNILDLIIKPFLILFDSFHPFLALGILCFFISLMGLYFYGKVTDQEKLKFIHKNIKLIHLEMMVRPNDLRELFRLLIKAIQWNLFYLKKTIFPSLIIIIPFCFLLLPIESHFAHNPIRVGNVFSLEIVQNQNNDKIQSIQLSEVPIGLELIESEMVSGPKILNGWYFRAKENGLYHLRFQAMNWVGSKRVVVSDSIQPINKTRELHDWLESLYSFEHKLPNDSGSIQSISVSYEDAIFQIPVLGFSLSWFSYFIIVFLIIFLIIKSRMKVY